MGQPTPWQLKHSTTTSAPHSIALAGAMERATSVTMRADSGRFSDTSMLNRQNGPSAGMPR